MNNNNAEPFHNAMDTIIITALIALVVAADDLRYKIIYDISVPQAKSTKVTKVESSPFTEDKPGGDVIFKPLEPDSTSVGRPTRKRFQATRMNIFSNKGGTYDVALVQALCMTQTADANDKRLSM